MITYWHNPRCSKSRAGLAYLEEKGADLNVRLYLKDGPSREEVETLRRQLDLDVVAFMRPKDKLFKELGLSPELSAEELMEAITAHPALLERPIAVKGDRAVIGRPTEALDTIL